ncbi:MAG: DUF4397 domain-containing protein [Chloroflexota bacterium]|nr:DUF4397 domain-containing protein [Chloroflexota bacterium]
MQMKRMNRAVITAIALALWVTALVSASAQTSETALLRFIHVVMDASPIDVYIDGELAITALAYGDASSYIDAPSGSHTILAAASGSTDVLWQQTIDAPSGAALTFVASSSTPLEFTRFAEDLNPIGLGKARFTAIHAVPGTPVVDVILADGRPVVPGLQYNQSYGTLDLPALSYELAVVPTGAGAADAIVATAPYALNNGASYILLLYGTADAPQVKLLEAATRSAAPDSAGLRVAHLVAGGTAIELFLDDTLIVPSLNFGDSSLFASLPAGTYNASARIIGIDSLFAETEVIIEPNAAITLYVATVNGEARILIMNEELDALDETTAIVSIVNIAGDNVTLSATSDDGAALVTDMAMTGSTFNALPASTRTITITTTQADASVTDTLASTLYGGTLYSNIVIPGADSATQLVTLRPAALQQSIASAPIDGTAALLPTPTPVPTEAAIAAVTATPAPAAEIRPEATPAATTNSPTARILLNANANLHLRLYPSVDAFSLGLAPASAVLVVQGRAGEPALTPGTEPDPDAEPFLDPVDELLDGEDLDPATTWLFVSYATPDGGTINAWVNALYLAVSDPRGRVQRLADLPTVPSNRAGTSLDTAIAPPTAADRTIFATTGNVAAGTRVHIRRLPDITAESLALVPGDTRVVFIGLTEARDWYYVRFEDANGTATGWVSALYVTAFDRLDQSVDLARIEELGELVILTGEERGGVVLSAPPTAGADPSLRDRIVGEVINLNVGANLHLRRFDNNSAESLALLPGGTSFIVEGQNFEGLWLLATYEGQTGWVFAQYVSLTRNGQEFDLLDVPVIEEAIEATEEPTPGA